MTERTLDGHVYTVEWSDFERVYVAVCLDFEGVALYGHGDTVEQAVIDARLMVQMYKSRSKS